MTKTLIVQYLPSGEQSKTQKLLDIFIKNVIGSIETLDLLQDPAPIHDINSLAAYYKRNNRGEELSSEESKYLETQDRMKEQLLSCDILVLACPMHNFGLPAAVKAYLDAVIMDKETFEMGKKLMAGRKALTLYTSGGDYNDKLVNLEYPNWDTLTLLAKINFSFMGFDECPVISASLSDESTYKKHLSEAKEKIIKIAEQWY